jgi:hypothetical protein
MAGGDVDGRVGPPGAAALRWTPDDEERLRRCSATSRTSWRGLIASEDGGRDEPATAARWPTAHGSVGAGARARGAQPPRLIGQGAGVSRGAHGRRGEGGGRRHPCPPWTLGEFGDLGPDGLRGRARVWAGAGLGRAWWATACEATAAGEGNEGAGADFGSWAAERRWAAGRGCWAASCPRIEGATEDFRDWQKGLMG